MELPLFCCLPVWCAADCVLVPLLFVVLYPLLLLFTICSGDVLKDGVTIPLELLCWFVVVMRLPFSVMDGWCSVILLHSTFRSLSIRYAYHTVTCCGDTVCLFVVRFICSLLWLIVIYLHLLEVWTTFTKWWKFYSVDVDYCSTLITVLLQLLLLFVIILLLTLGIHLIDCDYVDCWFDDTFFVNLILNALWRLPVDHSVLIGWWCSLFLIVWWAVVGEFDYICCCVYYIRCFHSYSVRYILVMICYSFCLVMMLRCLPLSWWFVTIVLDFVLVRCTIVPLCCVHAILVYTTRCLIGDCDDVGTISRYVDLVVRYSRWSGSACVGDFDCADFVRWDAAMMPVPTCSSRFSGTLRFLPVPVCSSSRCHCWRCWFIRDFDTFDLPRAVDLFCGMSWLPLFARYVGAALRSGCVRSFVWTIVGCYSVGLCCGNCSVDYYRCPFVTDRAVPSSWRCGDSAVGITLLFVTFVLRCWYLIVVCLRCCCYVCSSDCCGEYKLHCWFYLWLRVDVLRCSFVVDAIYLVTLDTLRFYICYSVVFPLSSLIVTIVPAGGRITILWNSHLCSGVVNVHWCDDCGDYCSLLMRYCVTTATVVYLSLYDYNSAIHSVFAGLIYVLQVPVDVVYTLYLVTVWWYGGYLMQIYYVTLTDFVVVVGDRWSPATFPWLPVHYVIPFPTTTADTFVVPLCRPFIATCDLIPLRAGITFAVLLLLRAGPTIYHTGGDAAFHADLIILPIIPGIWWWLRCGRLLSIRDRLYGERCRWPWWVPCCSVVNFVLVELFLLF